MKKIELARTKLSSFFNPLIGEISIKTYFTYYGVIHNQAMFALYKDDELYLRITETTCDILKEYPKITDPNINTQKYHLVPNNFISSETGIKVIKQIIQDIHKIKMNNKLKKKALIRHLLNMNINIERMLYRNGIKTINQFFALGAIKIFVRLIKNGNEGSPTLLYKLYGAINHIYADRIPENKKIALLQEVNEALHKEGLRKRFNI